MGVEVMLDSQTHCRLSHVVTMAHTFNAYGSNRVHVLQRNSYAELPWCCELCHVGLAAKEAILISALSVIPGHSSSPAPERE